MSGCDGHADACVTCGDVALAAVVVSVDGVAATVDAGGRLERVAVDLVGPVTEGDTVLCHAGVAIALLDPAHPNTADRDMSGSARSGHPGPPPTADSNETTLACPSRLRADSVEVAGP